MLDRWKKPVSGDFSQAANWKAGVPGVATNAVIAADGDYSVTITQPETCASLKISGPGVTLAIQSLLDTELALDGGRTILENGGTLSGRLSIALGAEFASYGGAFNGVIVADAHIDLSGTQELLDIEGNGINLVGSAELDATGDGAEIDVMGDQDLRNGVIGLGGSGAYASLWQGNAGGDGAGTLTLGKGVTLNQVGTLALVTSADQPGHTVAVGGSILADVAGGQFVMAPEVGVLERGGAISIGNGDTFSVRARTFDIEGAVTVTGGSTLDLEGAWSDRKGSITLVDSVLRLRGIFRSQALPTVAATFNSSVLIDGAMDNTHQTLTVGAGASFGTPTLTANGSITGGTIIDSGGGIVYAGGFFGGELIGVTYLGALNLTQASASVNIVDGITLLDAGGTGPGTLNVNGAHAVVTFTKTQTFDGATINLGGTFASLQIYDHGEGATDVTFGPGCTINQTGANAYFCGSLAGGAPSGDTMINKGAITLTQTSGHFSLLPNGALTFVNEGTVTAGAGETVGVQCVFDNKGAFTVSGGAKAVFQTVGTTSNLGTITVGANSEADFDAPLFNKGTIVSNQGLVIVNGVVTGGGMMGLNGGLVDIVTNSFNEDLDFTGQTGELEMADSTAYHGVIAGFSKTGGTSLVLHDIAFGANTTASIDNRNRLVVTDGTRTAYLQFSGDYSGVTFTVSDAGGYAIVRASGGPTTQSPPVLPLIAAMAQCVAPARAHEADPWFHPLAGPGAHAQTLSISHRIALA